jgi:hypothetical protein
VPDCETKKSLHSLDNVGLGLADSCLNVSRIEFQNAEPLRKEDKLARNGLNVGMVPRI